MRLESLLIARATRRVLEGRLRARTDPRARLQRADVDRVVARTAATFARLLAEARLPAGAGARHNVRAGIWTLALYRALKEEVGDEAYATELAADVVWRQYAAAAGPFAALGRLLGLDPRRHMHLAVRLGLLYPFGRPGYQWTARRAGPVLETDFTRCPVLEYFETQGEEALRFFRASWCAFDFPLAEALVAGGRYERAHTLSAGDDRCDMRWIAPGPRR